MGWTAPIDAYCERTGPEIWSEPANALTNAAFLAAALLAFLRWRRAGGGDRPALALIALVGVIGVGSALFHTLANRWSSLADVLPITAFISAYFALALRRFVGLSARLTLAATLVFLAASAVLAPLAEPLLGSSSGYLPALLALGGIGGWLVGRRHGAGDTLLLAGGVFAVSLLFRTLDGPVCARLPLGTHFAWHLLNALTLWLLLGAVLRSPPRPSGSS